MNRGAAVRDVAVFPRRRSGLVGYVGKLGSRRRLQVNPAGTDTMVRP